MLTIDGSYGEGGGQILRTALGLSLVTGTPFRIEKIRAGRKRPGLMRQHLTAVNAAQQLSRAEVEGAVIGSQQLTFKPGKTTAGEYTFSVGTAGSATLVLQTVLPALLTASQPSILTLEGGTHNPYAPPYDFLERAFLPLISRMGPKLEAKLDRYGFYPAGGGRFSVRIEPVAKLTAYDLRERGAIQTRKAHAIVSALPAEVGERELKIVKQRLTWEDSYCGVVEVSNSRGPGNALTIELACEHVTELFTGFGERGVRAEKVAEETVREVRRYLAADVPVGEYLTDQLLVPMALAGSGSFVSVGLSRHATTNIEVIEKFLDVEISVKEQRKGAWLVEVNG